MERRLDESICDAPAVDDFRPSVCCFSRGRFHRFTVRASKLPEERRKEVETVRTVVRLASAKKDE